MTSFCKSLSFIAFMATSFNGLSSSSKLEVGVCGWGQRSGTVSVDRDSGVPQRTDLLTHKWSPSVVWSRVRIFADYCPMYRSVEYRWPRGFPVRPGRSPTVVGNIELVQYWFRLWLPKLHLWLLENLDILCGTLLKSVVYYLQEMLMKKVMFHICFHLRGDNEDISSYSIHWTDISCHEGNVAFFTTREHRASAHWDRNEMAVFCIFDTFSQ